MSATLILKPQHFTTTDTIPSSVNGCIQTVGHHPDRCGMLNNNDYLYSPSIAISHHLMLFLIYLLCYLAPISFMPVGSPPCIIGLPSFRPYLFASTQMPFSVLPLLSPTRSHASLPPSSATRLCAVVCLFVCVVWCVYVHPICVSLCADTHHLVLLSLFLPSILLLKQLALTLHPYVVRWFVASVLSLPIIQQSIIMFTTHK
jgi:hypothetical protein